jgi:hypothetical protein
MRSHEHVACPGARPHEPRERFALDITREQQPPASRFHGEHEARFVVVGAGIDCRAIRPGMQHPHPAERIDRERLPGGHGAKRNAPGRSPSPHLSDAAGCTREKTFRHHDPPHAKPGQQIGHGVEVIGIGV